ECRKDEEIFEIDAGTGQKGRVMPEPEGETSWYVAIKGQSDFCRWRCTKKRHPKIVFGRKALMTQSFILGESLNATENRGDILDLRRAKCKLGCDTCHSVHSWRRRAILVIITWCWIRRRIDDDLASSVRPAADRYPVLDLSPIIHETLSGRYVLKREIGRGGAACVYLAHDVRHERLVAIKVLHRELSHALGAQRFLREIKLTASLQHPHILSIHDSGEAHDQLFYVMPYVEGESMRHRLTADNRLSIDDAVRIGREIAGALAYAHERGVVHRDIKPENILFSGGHAVLGDFGIARAINRAHEKITQQGTITGTPAYMSPEQARDRAFDGRSDVYSLACVLYEAIAGVPPFVGETPQQLLSQRISKTAPLLREFRHDVPTSIEAVIAKALSISPDDRFDDARAFSAALSAAIGNSGEISHTRVVRRPLTKSPWLWAAAVALLLTGGAASTPQARDQIDVLTGRVDTAQYAVMPFQYVGGHAPSDDQEPVSQGIYAAMRDWNGLRLASDMSVLDARHHAQEESLPAELAAARHVRAGKLVWGRVTLSADSMIVRATIYDAINNRSLRELDVAGPRDLLSRSPGTLRVLVSNLLRLPGAPEVSRSGDVGTRSLDAWHAYQEGQRALATWRVPAAIAAFDRAATADPDYAHAHAWLAQLQLWRGEKTAQWGPHVAVAMRNHASLNAREVSLVDALQAIQNGHAAEACLAYDAMRMRDSLDATAWLGLSYCRLRDSVIVRAGGKFAFRGSAYSAQRAYARALEIAPAAFAALPYAYLWRLFVVETHTTRRGYDANNVRYFGLPDLSADTLAYSARPYNQQGTTPFEAMAPEYGRALQRNRDVLVGLLGALTQRMPDNPDVFEVLARVLETRDEITGTPNGGYSALSALERAKSLATDTTQRVRIGASDVRLHLKLGDFSRAAAIGDSMLDAKPIVRGETAIYVSGIAALLGREHDAIRYYRASGESIADGNTPSVPILEDAATALFMRAALGVCDDSLRALRSRIDPLIDSYVNADQRGAVRTGILSRPLQFARGCLDAVTIDGAATSPAIFRAVQAIDRGNAANARTLLDAMRGGRKLTRPGDESLDFTLTRAWLYAALGDTAAAVTMLDVPLTQLPTLSPYVVFEPGMAASVGRAMAYRAELAARRRDPATAALWAGRVITLWSHADASVTPMLNRMKTLAAQRN
ncbi:MAG: protein kinase, partial [Gemmatimonadetes bacterium]|nr:protein kinase [Gemmatimonadota bacterium]